MSWNTLLIWLLIYFINSHQRGLAGCIRHVVGERILVADIAADFRCPHPGMGLHARTARSPYCLTCTYHGCWYGFGCCHIGAELPRRHASSAL